MLSFDIRALGEKAARVDGALAPDDPVWQEGDPLPSEPISVSGRLSGAGAGRFYFSGEMSGGVGLECRRCLVDVRGAVDEEVHAVFAPADDHDVSDPDVFIYDPGARELDLRPAVREMWLLSVPRYVLCNEACKGLCPRCGEDLNAGPCSCQPDSDTRSKELTKAATKK